ncbi:MAG: fibronectin type III domain-containing protein [Anaerovoracaceae bacterium]
MKLLSRTQSKSIAIILAGIMLISCFTFLQTTAYADTAKKQPYKDGDNISNAEFYIAVDGNDDGKVDDTYYYTEEEIKDYNEKGTYVFDNHTQNEIDVVKGAKLSSLIKNLGGTSQVDSTDKIKYMEHDAYHSSASQVAYIDTVDGLTNKLGTGNGSGYGGPADTIVGYAGCEKENEADKEVYTTYKDYSREASTFRGFRQTDSANSAVLKQLIGVVISGNVENYGKATGTQGGYTLIRNNAEGKKIADDYSITGLIAGMKWAAAPQNVAWAKTSDPTTVITVEGMEKGKPVQKVPYTYKEGTFFNAWVNGTEVTKTRSQLAYDTAKTEAPNNIDKKGKAYTYYGYNKPMYVRYQGVWLEDILSGLSADQKVFIADENEKLIDITKNVEDYFVAYYYSQSKSSTNISNGKRVPLNYDYAVLVDTASARVEYSNVGDDYTTKSGKEATTYKNTKGIIVTDTVAAPTGGKATLTKYNGASFSWKAVKGATGYQVSYQKAGDSKWNTANTTKTTYKKSALTRGVKYTFKVKAYKAVKVGEKTSNVYGESSSTSQVITLKEPTVKLKKSGKTGVEISYTNISGENGYEISKSTKKTSGFKKIKTMSANKTSYTDKKLKTDKTYYYKVRSFVKSEGKTIYGPFSSVKGLKI